MMNGNKPDGKDILNSWKEISGYLEHNIRTCSRWEKNLGLPVHRYDNDSSRSTVFAYKSELDQWLEGRKNNGSFFETRKPFARITRIKGSTLSFALLAVLITVALSVVYFNPLKKMPSSAHGIVSIGIQPFENANSSEYDEYLALGITNEISSYLSSSENIRIIILAPAQELTGDKLYQNKMKADYILNGSVQKNENYVSLRYELVNARNKKIVIKDEVGGKLEDIQSIKESMCRQIHEKLDIAYNELMTYPLTPVVKNHEAIDTFFKGEYILNHIQNKESDPWKLYHRGKYYYGSYSRESNETAINLFHEALEIEEEFAEAYIGLAQCYLNYVNMGWDNSIKWLDKAEDLLAKVQSVSPKYPEYFSSLTKLYLLRCLGFNEETKEMAFDAVKKGLEMYPEHHNLNSISSYCSFLEYGEGGDTAVYEKALEYGEKSFWQNPLSMSNLFYTELLLLDEQFDKGLGICEIVKKIDGTLMTHFRIGEIYYYAGELEKSRAIFSQIENPLNMKIGAQFYLGMIAAQNKNAEDVRIIVKRLENLSMKLLEDDLRFSSIYFGIGNEEEGFRHLDNFFSKPITQRLKYNYERYIALDKNFSDNIKAIRSKYFE